MKLMFMRGVVAAAGLCLFLAGQSFADTITQFASPGVAAGAITNVDSFADLTPPASIQPTIIQPTITLPTIIQPVPAPLPVNEILAAVSSEASPAPLIAPADPSATITAPPADAPTMAPAASFGPSASPIPDMQTHHDPSPQTAVSTPIPVAVWDGLVLFGGMGLFDLCSRIIRHFRPRQRRLH